MFEDLIQQKLVHKKTYSIGPFAGLSVHKYSRSVFYENRWGEDPRLLECRGIILDFSNNIITYPFTKVFNYFSDTGATETGLVIDHSTTVLAPRKINGFMAACSLYNNDLLVSTTGTLDSPHAELARSVISTLNVSALKELPFAKTGTFLFEISHEDDPHIISEEPGAYLIGYRENKIGSPMALESSLDAIADIIGAKRPECITTLFGELVARSKHVKHEGFMVRDASTGETLCKIKSPYYLTKKFLMRLHENKVQSLFLDQQSARAKLDEEYYPLLDHIVQNYTYDEFNSMDERTRAKIIEDYLGG